MSPEELESIDFYIKSYDGVCDIGELFQSCLNDINLLKSKVEDAQTQLSLINSIAHCKGMAELALEKIERLSKEALPLRDKDE